MKKTREEVAKLKEDWLKDAGWDIEETEGFEEYYDELKEYREVCEAGWKIAREAEEAEKKRRLSSKMCPMMVVAIPGFGVSKPSCLMEQCALWVDEKHACAMLYIARELNDINVLLPGRAGGF